MAQTVNRIPCPKCGSNNFDNVALCWSCGQPLRAPAQRERPGGLSSETLYQQPAYAVSQSGDSGVARRAAIALALTMPWFGLPVGWAFMMIEDHRRQAIGRLCATWSAIALVVHIALMYYATAAILPAVLKYVTPTISNFSKALGPGGGGITPESLQQLQQSQ